MKSLLFTTVLLLLVGCATPNQPTNPSPEPQPQPQPDIKPSNPPQGCLWIRGKDGNPLEPRVSLPRKKLCNMHLQGSGFVDGNLYGYATKNKLFKVECSDVSGLISGEVKYAKDKNKYGTGVQNRALTPVKSIAVDKRFIPYGSTVYIPALKGLKYTFEGKEYIHDGKVVAEDTGQAIKGNHIDFFIGPQLNPWAYIKQFPFVKSTSSATFDAYVGNKKLTIWSTWYYLPFYNSCEQGR